MRVEIFFLDNVGSPYLGKKKKKHQVQYKKRQCERIKLKKKFDGTKKEKGFNLSLDLAIQSLMFARKRDQYLSTIQTQSL
jgi:hypothetical protein